MSDDSGPIVLFDGECNLCQWSVQFILQRDPRGVFRFASLQSERARDLLKPFDVDPGELSTMMLIEDGRCHLRSDAALGIARHLRWPWSWAATFRIIPRPLRDVIYRFVSRHRYRWFGRTDRCLAPGGDVQARFLD